MDRRRIGSLEVSLIGLGTNNFGFFMEEGAVPPVVDAALDAGINFFDTSDSYGESEVLLGRALGRRRDEVIVATKFGSPVDGGPGGASPAYVRSAIERSLTRLGTDRIDLYQIHRPDPETPIGDTLGVLDDLVQEGKVREIGCSNFTAPLLREAEKAAPTGGARFVSVQNQWNLLHREDELDAIPECARLGLAYLPYFPLASGLLSGKYARGEGAPPGTRLVHFGDDGGGLLSDRNFDLVEALASWAGQRGHTLLELAMAWLVATPVVASVIAGATTRQQVLTNAATGDWKLTPEEVDQVDRLTTPAAD